MRILLAASDPAELKGFGQSFPRLVTGVGPIQAAAATAKALSETKADIVFSLGSAGSLGGLRLGETCSFSSVISLDQDLTAFHLPPGATLGPGRETISSLDLEDRTSSLVLATAAHFASAPPKADADAQDMEAYGVAMAARLFRVPCFAVKVITDIVGERISIPEYTRHLRQWREGLPVKVRELLQGL